MQSPTLTSDTFSFFAALLKKHLGFDFPEEKSYLLNGRLLAVLEQYQLPSLTELIAQLRQASDAQLLAHVLDAMTIGETYFFRDTAAFDSLRHTLLPQIIAARGPSKTIRIWCAAASSGQEAFSIAMLLRSIPGHGTHWYSQILATDINKTALQVAQKGIYSTFELARGISEAERTKSFRDLGNDQWQMSEEIQRMITWRHHNLMNALEPERSFDLILCRNVLIYFDNPTKLQVLHLLRQELNPNGMLMLARPDSINGLEHGLTPVVGHGNVFIRH